MSRIAPPLVTGLVVLAAWEALCRAYAVPPYIFPMPSAIALELWRDAPQLLRALAATIAVTFAAFALSVALGTLAAFLFVQSRAIERSLFPYAVMLQVTPIVAIAPLIVILVKNTQAALVICATVVAVFPIIANTTAGLRSVDPGLRDLFRLEKASRLQTLMRLRIPSALPFFFAGLRISSGLALIGAVVAEFVAGTGGRNSGLASVILQASYDTDIPRMFAALVLITLAGVALFLTMAGAERLALGTWHAPDPRD